MPMSAMKPTVVATLKACSGKAGAVPNGGSYQTNTGNGIRSISGLPAGVTGASGNGCSSTLPMTRIWKMDDRFHHCARSSVRSRRPKKTGGQETQALGRSRGGFSTKIHVTVDGLGNPLCLTVTAGQAAARRTQLRAVFCNLAVLFA